MAKDNLGEFLFDNDVPPDDFNHFRERIIGDEIAVVEGARHKSFFMTDERGGMIYKLVPELARLSLLRYSFSVRFMDNDKPRTVASFHELGDDLGQLELISVEYYWPEDDEDEKPEGDSVSELFAIPDEAYDVDEASVPVFFWHGAYLSESGCCAV